MTAADEDAKIAAPVKRHPAQAAVPYDFGVEP
jgi:hypothetical protein